MLTLSSTSSTRRQLEEAVLNGLFPETFPFSRAYHPINLVRSCGSRQKNKNRRSLSHTIIMIDFFFGYAIAL
jgi:hypothetical protein